MVAIDKDKEQHVNLQWMFDELNAIQEKLIAVSGETPGRIQFLSVCLAMAASSILEIEDLEVTQANCDKIGYGVLQTMWGRAKKKKEVE